MSCKYTVIKRKAYSNYLYAPEAIFEETQEPRTFITLSFSMLGGATV